MTHSIPHPTGVVPPLARLVMKSGSLENLLPARVADWDGLAGVLRDAFPPEPGVDHISLHTSYHAHGMVGETISSGYDLSLNQPVSALLRDVMVANGQWDYLAAQPWYVDGTHVVAIDVNYYPHRQGQNARPSFHKDTAGSNAFVTLLFDNTRKIPATEWFVDVGKPGLQRRRAQQDLLPRAFLADLDRARAHLRATLDANEPVSGGLTEGTRSYVSWVDDLVWHATPSALRRHEITAEHARRIYGPLADELREHGELPAYYEDSVLGEWISVVELLGSVAECGNTELRRFLGRALGPQDVDLVLARQAWDELYTGEQGGRRYQADVEERGKTPWRLTGRAAIAGAYDPNAPGSSTTTETPAGLSSRPRRNSDTNTLLDVLLHQYGTRSFLRSWVRVVPVHSDEVRALGEHL
ncbi:hypothetical protein [Actinosynnema pretiosum]|uniref:Uncharacterized protein n=1 Tax=Actinosynnema pretiosum TaxID=42197 RepID=A0A290Z3D5_9PSEU|nr:hypothetical protein [Actinosynnema pretiosum]ATE53518.1 hypothetical protein CNX65_09620 [Actinosynnema pretiosum]